MKCLLAIQVPIYRRHRQYVMQEEAFTVEVGRFAEQSALIIVDNKTEIASVFDLSEKGGTYQFEKETDGIKQLAK